MAYLTYRWHADTYCRFVTQWLLCWIVRLWFRLLDRATRSVFDRNTSFLVASLYSGEKNEQTCDGSAFRPGGNQIRHETEKTAFVSLYTSRSLYLYICNYFGLKWTWVLRLLTSSSMFSTTSETLNILHTTKTYSQKHTHIHHCRQRGRHFNNYVMQPT